jgi:hypothetical protein
VTTWDPHVSEVSSARCEAVRLHAGAHGSVVHCTVMRAPGLSGGNAQLGRAESKENWTGLRIAGPCAMSPFFYFILFSALFPNLNLNSNLNSSFYGSSPQIIFVRLGVLILNIFIYIYILGVCPCVATGVHWDEHRHISKRVLYFLRDLEKVCSEAKYVKT